ncbi:MAG: hypothetical protein GEU91_04505 [Rhizobiales bacterium]|nr:hypothetical protein [Hyphomicrobiales bacterium]
MRAAMERAKADGITHLIFGDLFLPDVRAYREAKLKEAALSSAPAVRAQCPRDARAWAKSLATAGRVVASQQAILPTAFLHAGRCRRRGR